MKIAGKKAEARALKVGMTCDFRYFGVGDLARSITCKQVVRNDGTGADPGRVPS